MFRQRVTYRVWSNNIHAHITVWVDGAHCGSLVFAANEAQVANAIIKTLRGNGATNIAQRAGPKENEEDA